MRSADAASASAARIAAGLPTASRIRATTCRLSSAARASAMTAAGAPTATTSIVEP
jgi:hypothetical protein